MTHLGDITKINGAEIEPVDVITGGSPCQDLSVAGKRAGLAGERSGLYMDQIRIIKEMREHDRSAGRTGELVRPRYMVWENVPGAFSSNRGKDFGAVLEEAIRVSEPEAPAVPVPDGGWPVAGCLYASDGSWSVAWRQHDAQYWGTPQRRKRIALVADFGGSTAAEILFERKGVSGNTEPCGAAGKGSAGDTEGGAGSASYCIQGNCIDRSDTAGCNGKGWTENVSYTLNTIDRPAVMNAAAFSAGQGAKAGGIGYQQECSPSLKASPSGTNTTQTVLIYGEAVGCDVYNKAITGNVAKTLNSAATDADHIPCVVEPVCCNGNIAGTLDASYFKGCGERNGCERDVVVTANGETGENQIPVTYQEVTGALCANSHPGSYTGQDAYNDMLVAGCFQNTGRGWWNESETGETLRTPCGGDSTKANLVVSGCDFRNNKENGDLCGTLQAKPNGGYSLNFIHPVRVNSIVRRLTPMECERLQGFPDGWTDIGDWTDSKGKLHKASDTPRYKALGNSIAVGCANNRSGFWMWLMKRISAQYERTATLGSLFDGIGGFPLAWEAVNGKGTARWASEIEEFPIAVTKYHFPEVDV